MSELEEKLEGILGDPQAMAQIMSLAQSLNLGGPGQGQSQPPQPEGASAPAAGPDTPSPPPPPPAAPGAGLAGMLGGLDPATLSAAARLMGQFSGNGREDQRVALLTALRPFVKEERYAKLDKAIQIAKLSRLIRGGLELLRQRKEDGHV